MNNGFMAKAAAGAGTGLALAGQMGFQAKLQGDLEAQRGEIMAKRDQVLQGYENQRAQGHDATLERIHGADRASAERVGIMNKEAHLEGIDKQLSAKDNKPITLPKGAKLIGVDGTVLAENNGDEDGGKPITVPKGAAVIDKTGKELYRNPDEGDDGLPKKDKDIDSRINDLRTTITARMGNGFMEKLTEPDRKDFDTLFTKAAKMIRNKATMEDAYATVVDDLERLKAKVTKPGETSPAVNTFRDKFKY